MKSKAARNPNQEVNIELVPIVSQAITTGKLPEYTTQKLTNLITDSNDNFTLPDSVNNFFVQACNDYPRSLRSIPGWLSLIPLNKVLDGKITKARSIIQSQTMLPVSTDCLIVGLVFAEAGNEGQLIIQNSNRNDYRILSFAPDLIITPKSGEFFLFPLWQKYIILPPSSTRKLIIFEYSI